MCVSLGIVRCGLLAALGLILIGTPASRAAEPLFRETVRRSLASSRPSDEPKTLPGLPKELQQVIALEYSVLLYKEGIEEAVNPATHSFRAGDKIRVRIQPLNGLYLYIFYRDAGGRRRCLLPADRNTPWLAKQGQPVELPTEGTAFEFDGKSGEDELTVVALEKPDDDLAAMCDLICKKTENKLTPEERITQGELRMRCQARLKVLEDRQSHAISFRGAIDDGALAKVSAEWKQQSAAAAVLEEPPRDRQMSTLALVASKLGSAPALLVTIPLKSGPAKSDSIKSAKRP